MDQLAPAPGSAVPGAPPALRRPLTPADGSRQDSAGAEEASRASRTRTSTTEPTGGSATNGSDPATSGRYQRTRSVDGTLSLAPYLPAFGLLCAAAAVWVGTRCRPRVTPN